MFLLFAVINNVHQVVCKEQFLEKLEKCQPIRDIKKIKRLSKMDTYYVRKPCIWPSEIETELINEVYKRRHVWDCKHKYFSKKGMKRDAYDQIASTLCLKWPNYSVLFTGELVLRKFQNLRTYFQKELKKYLNINNADGGTTNYQPRWEHFRQMSFVYGEDVNPNESSLECQQASDVLITSDSPSIHYLEGCETSEEVQSDDTSKTDSFSDVKNIAITVSSEENDQNIESNANISSNNKDKSTLNSRMKDVQCVALIKNICSDSTADLSSAIQQKQINKQDTIIPDFTNEDHIPEKCVKKRMNIVQNINVKRKNVQSVTSEDVVNEAYECLKKLNNDTDDAYGHYVAKMLSSIHDPLKRELARLEIQKTLIKFKYGEHVEIKY